MRRTAWLVVAAVLAACPKARGPVDSGVPPSGELDGGPRLRRTIDLRTALVLAFPEYRGVPKVDGTALVTRTLSGRSDWGPVREELARRAGVHFDEDGGWTGTAREFRFALKPDGERATVSVALPFGPETIVRIFQAPAPISSADLALLLPRGPGVRVEQDLYELHMAYVTETEHRAAFLVHQAALLLLGNGQWRPVKLPEGWQGSLDAGQEALPERFDVELAGVSDGARFWAHRQGRYVDVLFSLVTDAPEAPPRVP